MNQSAINKVLDKIMIALSICETRIKMYQGEMFSLKEIGKEYEGISDDIHYMFVESKAQCNFTTAPWFRKLQKKYKDVLNEASALGLVN